MQGGEDFNLCIPCVFQFKPDFAKAAPDKGLVKQGELEHGIPHLHGLAADDADLFARVGYGFQGQGGGLKVVELIVSAHNNRNTFGGITLQGYGCGSVRFAVQGQTCRQGIKGLVKKIVHQDIDLVHDAPFDGKKIPEQN